jgi:hypothetical protein
MDAKEFRLDNYVYVLGEVRQIRGVSQYNQKHRTQTVVHYFEFDNTIGLKVIHLKPIPITEEWKDKLNLNEFNELLGGTIEYQNGYVYIGGSDSVVNSQCFKVKIEFVHEYQNLYFALTNTELEIK